MKKAARPYVMTARAAKAEATRARIRGAAMALYGEQQIENFTLDDVAARAGTTVQTVLRVFHSKDNLVLAALRELAASGVPLKPTPRGDVAAAIEALCELYEAIGELIIQRLGDERRYPALKPSLDEGREAHREWAASVFAPQIERLTGEARAQFAALLCVATDVYVWKLLRRDQGLTRPATEAAMRRMVTAIVEREEKDGATPVAELVGRREPAA